MSSPHSRKVLGLKARFRPSRAFLCGVFHVLPVSCLGSLQVLPHSPMTCRFGGWEILGGVSYALGTSRSKEYPKKIRHEPKKSIACEKTFFLSCWHTMKSKAMLLSFINMFLTFLCAFSSTKWEEKSVFVRHLIPVLCRSIVDCYSVTCWLDIWSIGPCIDWNAYFPSVGDLDADQTIWLQPQQRDWEFIMEVSLSHYTHKAHDISRKALSSHELRHDKLVRGDGWTICFWCI